MDEVIKQLGSIERNGPNSVRFAQRPGVSIMTPTIAGSIQPIGNGNIHTPVHQNAGSSGQLPTAPETIQPWNPVNPETTVASYASPPQSWAAVAAQAPPVTSPSTLASDKTRRTLSGSWKQNLHFLQATKPLQDISTSNEVNIVAYKVKKNVTETDMRNWQITKRTVHQKLQANDNIE